jgi:CPA2 family monovalent cation:H+ antiporter-2
MEGSHYLLINLVLALFVALIGAALAVRLRQSPLLGYIVAGMVIGPFTPGYVADGPTMQSLAEVGVILLMFTIGTHISFRDLLREGRAAIFGGTLQIILTTALGYLAGKYFGWQDLEALFLGAFISICSSIAMARILSDKNELDTPHGNYAMAWSSVQDLSTILVVVILTSMSRGGENLLSDIAIALARAGTFLVILGPVGYFLLPHLFNWVAGLRNREVFILAVAVVALGTAYASSLFGLSLALGAFIAGVVVGESDLSLQVTSEIAPLRDIFAGLFFVSIGMLVNLNFMAENLLWVLVVWALIALGKGAITAALVALTRRNLRQSILTAASMAHSGEFSFLLASLGLGLGVVSAAIFNDMMVAAVLSIAVSPLLYEGAEWAVKQWEDRRPLHRVFMDASLDGVVDANGSAIICGYGRVGQVVGRALTTQGLPFVVIDQDRHIVMRLRSRGITALLGDATNPLVLEEARITDAGVLVVAIPDAIAVRQIVDYCRRTAPSLDIVARTHSLQEQAYLLTLGVAEVVMGEQELALEIARHTMGALGVETVDAVSTVNRLRALKQPEDHLSTGELSSLVLDKP